MLIRQGEARSFALDRRLACMLAAIAGALNTAGFHAMGLFSANMTGNVSLLSNHIASGEIASGALYAVIVLLFITGAAASTLLINAGRRRGVPGIYALSILAEAGLLAVLGAADLGLPGGARGPVLVLGLSFLMGLQNATVTRISNARVRTTHVSGMSTDIGIEIAMLLEAGRGREEAAENRARLRLHVATVLAFLLGGVAGAVVYEAIGGWLLLGAAFVLLCIAAPGLFRHSGAAFSGALPRTPPEDSRPLDT